MLCCNPCANNETVKKIANCKAAVIQHSNVVDQKNENADAGVGRLSFPVVDKSVGVEVNKKVAI